MLFVCHPKFCISIVFSFSWGHFNSQEKLDTLLMHNFGVRDKDHYGMLWYFWSGQLEVFDPALLTHWQNFLLSSQVTILCLFTWRLSLCFFMQSGYHAFNVLFFKSYNTRRAMKGHVTVQVVQASKFRVVGTAAIYKTRSTLTFWTLRFCGHPNSTESSCINHFKVQ